MANFPQSSKIYTLGKSGVRIRLEQQAHGSVYVEFAHDNTSLLTSFLILQDDKADIAALGFPTEPPDPPKPTVETVETAEEVEG